MRKRPSLAAMLICCLAVSTVAGAQPLPRQRLPFNDNWRFHLGDTPEAGEVRLNTVQRWLMLTAPRNTLPATQPSSAPTSQTTNQTTANPPTSTNAPTTLPGQSVADARPLPRDWSFLLSTFDDSSWRSVTVPHDWAIEGPFVQALPGETGKRPFAGVAWYRKTFELEAGDVGRSIFLDIDGAMSHAMVWINGQLAGGWPYGYASFRIDLSKFVQPGRNFVSIRLQNPPDSSRWYPGAGLYRNVWLVKADPIHIAQWGVFVTTPVVSDESATIHTQVTLANTTGAAAQTTASVQLFERDSAGNVIGEPLTTASATVAIKEKASVVTTLTTQLAKPKRWSTDTPQMYVARVRIEQDGRLIDQYDQPFGVRTIAFNATDGFLLNNKRVPLRGVCEHHDLGALGSAFNTRAMERKLEILKSMGVNALRTSHNPPAPEVLDLCDRMGIVVFDEAFDCWKLGKTRNDYGTLFNDWSERDVRALVRRDRNHPSVIAWSIGNEVLEQGKVRNARPEDGIPVGQRLSGLFKEEDPSRPTTIGFDVSGSGFNGMNRVADVLGYNYKPTVYARFRAEVPQQPLVGSETASTISSRGEYFFPVSDNKADGRANFQMSSYDLYAPPWAMAPDAEFAGQEKNPSVAGEFVWTGFDYLGEPTPYSSDSTNLLNFTDPEARARMEAQMRELGKITVPSRSSYFGIIDLAGFPKDRFYLYQAHWRPELPMAHILPHWNWPERVGQVTPVHVYTSGDEAELFLNGRSLGRKKKEPFTYRLRWDDVVYEPGELKVQSYKAGQPWADATQQTTGDAKRLKLIADRTTIRSDGADLSFVTLSITDDAGRVVPRSNQSVRFSIEGPGEIVATDNGDATDHASFQSPQRKAYNGLALAIVRAQPGANGKITLVATADGLETARIELDASSGAAK